MGRRRRLRRSIARARERIARAIDGLPFDAHPRGSFVMAGMATMPSRTATFPIALRSIVRQVDRLYLYLDGYDAVPGFVLDDPRIVPVLSREVPGLRGNGKFLGIRMAEQPGVYLGVDDDIYYPRGYARRLVDVLASRDGRVVAGLHGDIFAGTVESYARDKRTIHFCAPHDAAIEVDLLGSGVSAMDTRVMDFDVRHWREVNMIDIGLAFEAARRAVPMICIARPAGSAIPLAECQVDSLYVALLRDDEVQTRRLLELREARAVAAR